MSIQRWRNRRPSAPALLMGLVLLAGTCIAGDEQHPVLAVVNGHEIRLSYVYTQIEALPLGEQLAIRQQLDRFSESVVHEEVLFQSVLASDFEGAPELREQAKRLIVEYVIKQRVTDRVSVSGAAVQQYYERNSSAIRGEAVRASQIVLGKRERCEALLSSVATDTAFATAARAQSLHEESAERSGDIGLFMNHSGPYGFETELFDMQPGQMRVFDSPQGCHLVRITERETPPLPPLDEVETRIRELLERQQESELLDALLKRAKRSVTVERNP